LQGKKKGKKGKNVGVLFRSSTTCSEKKAKRDGVLVRLNGLSGVKIQPSRKGEVRASVDFSSARRREESHFVF